MRYGYNIKGNSIYIITLFTHLVKNKAFQLFAIELAWFSLQNKTMKLGRITSSEFSLGWGYRIYVFLRETHRLKIDGECSSLPRRKLPLPRNNVEGVRWCCTSIAGHKIPCKRIARRDVVNATCRNLEIGYFIGRELYAL